MAGFEPYTWTDEVLEEANGMSAAIGDDIARNFIGNEISALICEVQAWRRANADKTFVSGPNELRPKQRRDSMTPAERQLVAKLMQCRGEFDAMEHAYGMFPTDQHVFDQAICTCKALVMARVAARQTKGLFSRTVDPTAERVMDAEYGPAN